MRSRSLVLGELHFILASPGFARAARRRDILSYLVNAALEGLGQEISGSSIATKVYGRELAGDGDAIVRVELTRLRAALDNYYRETVTRPVRISIPKGSYAATFEFDPQSMAEGLPEPAVSDPTPSSNPIPPKPRRLYLWMACMALFILAAVFVYRELVPRGPQVLQLARLPGGQRGPSISPDGKQLAFVWNGEAGHGDIYTVPLAGATDPSTAIRRITNSAVPSMNPVWAPDGHRIAFARWATSASRNVFVKPASSPAGNDERLIATIHTIVQGIEWTPDGRYLILPDSPPGVPLGLFLVDVTNGARRRLVDDTGVYHPSISPDGKTLAYAGDVGTEGAVYLLPLGANYSPAGEPRMLKATLAHNVFFPRFSPDGKSVTYLKQGSIPMRYRLDTGAVQPIAGLPAQLSLLREFQPGRYICAAVSTHEFLARVSEDRAQSRPVPVFQTIDDDRVPALSPDGAWIAFRSRRSGVPALWIAKPDGTKPRKLWDGAFGWLRWSPDSKMVVFSSDSTDNGGRVYCGAPDSGAVRPLGLDSANGSTAGVRNPFYSRDGNWLYYASNRGGRFQLWRSPVRGGAPELVTRDQAVLGDEAEDGRSVFYVSRGAVWRLTLSDGASAMVSDDSRVLNLRAADGGLYVQTENAQGMTVNFLSLKTAEILKSFTPHMSFDAWYPEAGGASVVMGLRNSESHLEIRSVP